MSSANPEQEAVEEEAPPSSSIRSASAAAIVKSRPDRLSFEGFVYNANMVLEDALNPKRNRKVLTELIEKCKGVVIITIFTVGALLTVQYGTGVLMMKRKKAAQTGGDDSGEGGDGASEDASTWSAPSATSVGGISTGALIGGKRDNCLIFLMDDEAMEDFVMRPQSRIALDVAIALGRLGGEKSVGMDLPDKGTITVTFPHGAFAGLGLQVATLDSTDVQNHQFYGKTVSPMEIVTAASDGAVKQILSNTQVPDLYDKLDLMAKGEPWVPSDQDIKRSTRFAVEAHKKSIKFVKGELDESKSSGEAKQ